jgi:2-polyprenyl-6-methoxyphenol hydroxylase-like FAD-dependent oxidoreductase
LFLLSEAELSALGTEHWELCEDEIMPNVAIDAEVLIVGAGPVGLLLANECARRGLRWRIIEARSSQSAHSKALAIFPRTLEILDMGGLVGPFLEMANRVTSVAVAARGRTLAHMRFAPKQSPYQFIAMVSQGRDGETAGGTART